MMRQYRKDTHPTDHKQCEAHEKKDGELTGCCNYCTEMFRQLEDEIQNVSWDLTEHKTEFNNLQTFSDGVGRMFNTIKEQIEAMKLDIHKLKENGMIREDDYHLPCPGQDDSNGVFPIIVEKVVQKKKKTWAF